VIGRALRLGLAVALLAAWQNSLVHPVAHVDHAGQLVHAATGAAGQHDEQGSGPNALCDAIAAVAACVGGAALPPLAVEDASESFSGSRRGGAHNAPLLAYRSQAPPALL
jgi:hypothetical protein